MDTRVDVDETISDVMEETTRKRRKMKCLGNSHRGYRCEREAKLCSKKKTVRKRKRRGYSSRKKRKRPLPSLRQKWSLRCEQDRRGVLRQRRRIRIRVVFGGRDDDNETTRLDGMRIEQREEEEVHAKECGGGIVVRGDGDDGAVR